MSTVVKYHGVAKKGLMSGYHVFYVGKQRIAVSGRPGNLGIWKSMYSSLCPHRVSGPAFDFILRKMKELCAEPAIQIPAQETVTPTRRAIDELEPSEAREPRYWWTED